MVSKERLALAHAIQRNLDLIYAWQVNPFDFEPEQIKMLEVCDPLKAPRDFFFGRKSGSIYDLANRAEVKIDWGSMEDYVFHQLGKARGAIRGIQALCIDIPSIVLEMPVLEAKKA